MRILNIFNHYLGRGGEALAVEAVIESLSEIAALERCDFFSTDWVGADAPSIWKQVAWMLRNPASLSKIREYQLRFKPDVWLLHNAFPVGSAAIYPEAKRLRIPIIQYIHNFRPFSVNGYLWAGNQIANGGLSRRYWQEIRHGAWQNSRAKTASLALVLSLMHALHWWGSVKAWIAISDFMRDKFVSAGIPEEQIFTLRHFWRPKSKESANDGQHYLFLGRLTEAKGVNVLLDAWDILERQAGVNSPRLVIGGHGPLCSLVASRSARMRSVQFAGRLDGASKRCALETARALIVPSIWWEPLGLVVYEAYDYFRPVLAASSGGLPEIVIDHETGLLHEPGNAEQLAQQVMQLDTDSETRRAMGQQGRVWLEQNADEAKWRVEFVKIATHALNAAH